MPSMAMTARMQTRLTPALLNLTRLLTLPTLSLQQAVQQELIENPALEEIEGVCPACGGPLVHLLCPNCAGAVNRSLTGAVDGAAAMAAMAAPPSLADELLADLYASLPASEHGVARAVVGSLDEHGFLHETAAELARLCHATEERIAAVVQRLHEIGPPGIAARGPREWLLMQLRKRADEDVCCPYAHAIIADHLADLAAHRDAAIARELNITAADVAAVRRFIQRYLSPYPAGESRGTRPPALYLRAAADVRVTEHAGRYQIELAANATHTLRVNPLYRELARKSGGLTDAERRHVHEYLHRALMFLTNLRQRESTLQRVSEAIVARQHRFLRDGVRFLAPMTRLEIAAAVGLHESTVSRAVIDKMVQLPNGRLSPLSAFFVRALPVQDALREIVTAEAHPLNDQQLTQLLADRGYTVARRTVAKYRQQLHILPCQLR